MKIIRVKGPIYIDIVGGCNINGITIKNQRLTWNKRKVLPIEIHESTRIRIIGKVPVIFPTINTKFTSIKLGMSIWSKISESIVRQSGKRIVIMGPPDSGKSTFSLFLANKFIKTGLRTLVIDADIGQGDLAPPTCIGAAVMKEPEMDLTLVKADLMCFVGVTQPSKFTDTIIDSINKLLDESTNFDKCIINTDGFVSGNGLNYKYDLIRNIRPEYIVYLGKDDAFKKLKKRINSIINYVPRFVNGNSPDSLVKRPKYDRYVKRLDTYYRFLNNYNNKQLSIDAHDLKGIFFNKNYLFSTNPRFINEKHSLRDSRLLHFVKKHMSNGQFVGLGSLGKKYLVDGFGVFNQIKDGKIIMHVTTNNFDCIYWSNTILTSIVNDNIIKREEIC